MSSNIPDRLKAFGWFPVIAGILGILLLIQAIRLIWLVVTPLGPVGDWSANQVDVLAPQSRLSLFSSFDPFFRKDTAVAGTVVTSLQLTLFGIRMNEGSGLGSAILAGPDGVQDSYAVGDEILSGASLSSVAFDHVIIDRGGVMESLYLDQSVPVETVGAEDTPIPSPVLIAPAVRAASPNASAIASAVSMQARNVDGKVTGIVVSPQGNGALFQATGFRDGDIITEVNGKPVSSAADIEALKSQIAPGARISVNVERGANTLPISINLDGN